MLKIWSLFVFVEHEHLTRLTWLRKVRLTAGIFLLANGLTGHVDAQLQDGLVGYWSFDEARGTSTGDFSGNGNTGTLLNGATWVSGKSGTALSFDGADDYVKIPEAQSLNLSSTLTVSAWINNQASTDSSPSQDHYRIIASKGWAPDNSGSWTLAWRVNDGSLFFFAGRATSYRYVNFPYDNSQAGIWHLVTAVLDNGNISLYQDGVLQAGPVGIDSSKIRTDTSPILIGSSQVSNNWLRNWEGSIDEFRLYNRALSADEIASLYQQDNQSFNFSLANSMDLSAAQGTSATNTITANLVTGSAEPVSLSASGLPSGASASFSQKTCSPTCSSLLTIAAASSTPAGTYTITVTGAGGGVNKTTSFTLTVTSTASTTLTSPAQGTTFSPGQTVTATGSGTNLTWDIDLIGDGLASFKTGTGSSITFTVPANANSSQLVRIILSGGGGSVTRDYNIALASAPAPAFDFSLSNDGNKSVTQGQSVPSTITATLSSGSSQAVSFSTAGLPTGATASYSTSTSCTPTCSRTLNIETAASTPAGTYTITVTGAGGGVNKTTSFTLTVTSTASTTLTSPAQGTTFSPGQTVTATGSGTNLTWDIDLIGDGLASFKTGTGSSITFTVPANASSSQLVRIILSGGGGSVTQDYNIAVASSPAQLILTWQDNSNDEDNFAIERKTGTSGTYTEVALVAASSNSYVDTTVTQGINYCYRVRAVNSAGASAYTNEACGTVS